MKRFFAALAAAVLFSSPISAQPTAGGPVPLISQGNPADWIFAFKMNASAFPSTGSDAGRPCPFGGKPRHDAFSQRYVYAASSHPQLEDGPGLIGTSTNDPVGATFSEIFNGTYWYVVWNDQFQGFPLPDRVGPWGHSKGILAWNDHGDGLILQVSTPAWPGSGSARSPRKGEGNTLGCLTKARNNLVFSQHFFALRLSEHDVELVLQALENASVVAKPDDATHQLALLGGPQAIRELASRLGKKSKSIAVLDVMLSSGVRLISKPSELHVPPWQLVSAELSQPSAEDGPGLRTATWWSAPQIPTTDHPGDPGCWGLALHPGPVAIGTTGTWNGHSFSIVGGANHAKIGVSSEGPPWYTIFGDLNQQGALTGTAKNCKSSQNARGGLFFVFDNHDLHDSVASLIAGDTAPSILPRNVARRRTRSRSTKAHH